MLVLDAGDLLFKKYSAPIPEKELKAAVQKAYLILDSLNIMGYDAMGIGDDDLTLGKEFLLKISKRAKFPIISSNVFDEGSEKPLFKTSMIKEISGLRIGIFSLLSPDVFLGPSDPRRKGVIIRPPIETARDMVNELGHKTDMIILLSHLGYPKDVELALTVSGIHIIIGGHTGVNLTNPPVIKDTIIVQNSSKGMYGARLDLNFLHSRTTFYNTATKLSMENNLRNLQQRLIGVKASEAEKDQWQRAKESVEQALQQLEGKNYFTYSIFSLSESIKDHPEIKKMIETYKAEFKEEGKPEASKPLGKY
jgi:2',3'-cyclic-nucleotide 2'-phosphodiesterase (5'-nucleotidase family)